jgi:hypothetical protein
VLIDLGLFHLGDSLLSFTLRLPFTYRFCWCSFSYIVSTDAWTKRGMGWWAKETPKACDRQTGALADWYPALSLFETGRNRRMHLDLSHNFQQNRNGTTKKKEEGEEYR